MPNKEKKDGKNYELCAMNCKQFRTFALVKQEECVELLDSHGIRPTSNRIIVLRSLALSARPLTLAELEEKLLSWMMFRVETFTVSVSQMTSGSFMLFKGLKVYSLGV